MATIVQTDRPVGVGDEGFFMTGAILMALVLVGGFAFHLAMGRSTFAVAWPVHLHAFTFFGWVALYLTQNVMIATGRVDVHRRLGKLAAIWLPAMTIIGLYMTTRVLRLGTAPFFFEPAYFLFMSSLSLLAFVGLAIAAIVNRRRTQWHRRLMFCGMALLTGPGWGRLLPMPLLIPWAGWVAFAAAMLFPIAGVIADLRRSGRVHPGWWWGVGVMVATQLVIVTIDHSAFGLSIYHMVTEGSPGAALAPNAYPPSPLG
jgi:hypothetical protein